METGQRSAIADRAYQIWEREGRPEGRDMDHWLQAEQELAAGDGGAGQPRAAARRTAGSPSTAKSKSTRARAPRKAASTGKARSKKA